MALSGARGDDSRSDDPFLLMVNAWWEPLQFEMPEALRDLTWLIEIDTADPGTAERAVDASPASRLIGRSLVLLRGTQGATGG